MGMPTEVGLAFAASPRCLTVPAHIVGKLGSNGRREHVGLVRNRPRFVHSDFRSWGECGVGGVGDRTAEHVGISETGKPGEWRSRRVVDLRIVRLRPGRVT
jgi:hypothetical protein